jgi:hypothetical protein
MIKHPLLSLHIPLPPVRQTLLALRGAPGHSAPRRLQPGAYLVRMRYDGLVTATVERQVRGRWTAGEACTHTEWAQTVTVSAPQTVRLVVTGTATGRCEIVRG